MNECGYMYFTMLERLFKILMNPFYNGIAQPCLNTQTQLFESLNMVGQVEKIRANQCAIFNNIVQV